MTTITRENAEIKSFITGFLSDAAHDKQSSNSLLANVFRIHWHHWKQSQLRGDIAT